MYHVRKVHVVGYHTHYSKQYAQYEDNVCMLINCVGKGNSVGIVTSIQVGRLTSSSVPGVGKDCYFHQSIQPGPGSH